MPKSCDKITFFNMDYKPCCLLAIVSQFIPPFVSASYHSIVKECTVTDKWARYTSQPSATEPNLDSELLTHEKPAYFERMKLEDHSNDDGIGGVAAKVMLKVNAKKESQTQDNGAIAATGSAEAPAPAAKKEENLGNEDVKPPTYV